MMISLLVQMFRPPTDEGFFKKKRKKEKRRKEWKGVEVRGGLLPRWAADGYR